MPIPPSTPQDTQAAIAVLIAIVIGCSVFYWRIAIKVALIVALILVAYGVIAGFHDASSLLATHHR